jgi:beta-phosphoglucomutase-like phosphatase (HAD superfamily)
MLLRSLFLIIFLIIMVASLENGRALSSSRRPLLSGILFDIDGTLVHSDPIHFAVFQELLLKEDGFNDNAPIDEAFFRQTIAGRQNALIMADFFPDWSTAKREEWSLQKEARFRQMAASSMLERKMPGLDRLRAWIERHQVPRAAVTNAPRLNAEAMIAGIHYHDDNDNDDTAPFFQALVIGDECERAKPDPCPYLLGAKLIGVDPRECIVFEDSPSGARAGVAAGAYVVGILSSQDRSTLLDAGCHIVIQDYEDPALWAHLESRLVVVQTSSAEGD